jgi:hypothetical protein
MSTSKPTINSYDLDGVVSVGITPREEDIIVTGRSFEEAPETYRYLHSRGIYNAVFFQPCCFENKTRSGSGTHKAAVLKKLLENGITVDRHFEDDEIQKQAIEAMLDIPVVLLVHELTEKENIRHIDE